MNVSIDLSLQKVKVHVCVFLQEGFLTEEEFIQWSSSEPDISSQLMTVLFEVCHVRFGLRPQSLADEAKVVR